MSTSGMLDASALTSGYSQIAGIWDEMCAEPGVLRPHWERYIGSLSGLGGKEMARRWDTALHRIRENGVTYNVYGDPLGMDRPWNLDAIPFLIPPAEWSRLEAGLIQRARLLNCILADLYGPQKLLRDGHIPPALVFANSGFWRPLHGVTVPGNVHLHLLAVDLARSPDGSWWVLSDRTEAPSGAGYALENRIVLSETFPDLFRKARVQRLAAFFASFRETLLAISPAKNPRVVLLTPGPYNETYFEHSYLARYLGFTMVQGNDLTVRGSRVYLKSLEGLKAVDIILRRVDTSFCDPLELRSDSYLGVAGLVEAVRAGNVVVANALGSGLLETSAFMPFLPGLSRRLLGQDLALPSVATWWCGQPKALQYVRSNLEFLVIKPAFPSLGVEPVFGGKLAAAERETLLAQIEANPQRYAGQELVNLSSLPVWTSAGLAPRRVVQRVYLAAAGDSWIVMPGGLARVSPSPDTPIVSMQSGGGSKDTWVLSNKPVDNFTLLPRVDAPVKIHRGGGASDLPSRAVDHLFWLGRYAERAEHLSRVLRSILMRITGESPSLGTSSLQSWLKLHETLKSPYSRITKKDGPGPPDPARDLEQEILSLIFEEERRDSLRSNLNRAARAAAQVRDRLSSDLLRIVSQFATFTRSSDSPAWGYVSLSEALAILNRSIAILAALRGIELENMTRGPGWQFLSIGRRIERAILLTELFRRILVPLDPETWTALELLLEVADSSITYRSRYFTVLQVAPVLDLLMNDLANPRSAAFQIEDLVAHCRALSQAPSGNGWPIQKQAQLEHAATALFQADIEQLCQPGPRGKRAALDQLLSALASALPAFSDAITNTYFSHAEMARST